jgi:ABC-2 type transport system ATP-binding protein
MDSVITTCDLAKRYGSHVAVADLSLDVRRGEIYGFLGLNGAGKTTTIRMLLGMITPNGGTAEILGTPVRSGDRALWARVGYLVETPHAYPELTVRENLDALRRLHRLATPESVERIMERLLLTDYAHRRAGTLSLGNQQRLGLAKALLHSPEVLILDEPTNSLDPAGVVEVRELLRDLAFAGVTIFMSSHILGEVARLATRIGILHRGRLVEETSAADLEARRMRSLLLDAHDRRAACAALGAAGLGVDVRADGMLELHAPDAIARPDEVARLLVEANVPPTHLAVHQEDLETHFLRLVGVHEGARA